MNLSIYAVNFDAPMFHGISISVASDKKHAEKMTLRRLRKDWQLDQKDIDDITRLETKRISQIGVVETKKFADIIHLEMY